MFGEGVDITISYVYSYVENSKIYALQRNRIKKIKDFRGRGRDIQNLK